MPLQNLDAAAKTEQVLDALTQDGAVVIRNLCPPKLVDAVLDECRPEFDAAGRLDENDFHGDSTLRISRILAVSPSSADLVAHPLICSITE